MEEEYNIYCDESCHLEHDNYRFMVLGGIKCPKNSRKRISREIQRLKKECGLGNNNEIKWQSISKNKLNFYLRLVDYFFENEELTFRAIIVDKEQVKLEDNQKFIDFYYKMYFYVVSWLITPKSKNNVYLDKVDSKSIYRVNQLHKVLCNSQYDFDMQSVVKVQNVSSYECELLQLTDLFIGAISYTNRGLKDSEAKLRVINRIIEKSGYDLKKSTIFGERKFNIFKIKLEDRTNNVSI